MELILGILGVALAHLVAVVSPGPSFLVVTRTALSQSRRAGVWTAVGLGVGSVLWALAALFGLKLLFTAVPWLYAGLKLAGALYLFYLAVMLWRHAQAPLPQTATVGSAPGSGRQALRLGLLTQLANPKAAVFFGSVFVALLPPEAPGWLPALLLAIIFATEFAWYGFIALAFSTLRLRRAYAGIKAWIDRAAGLILGALGVRLITGTP